MSSLHVLRNTKLPRPRQRNPEEMPSGIEDPKKMISGLFILELRKLKPRQSEELVKTRGRVPEPGTDPRLWPPRPGLSALLSSLSCCRHTITHTHTPTASATHTRSAKRSLPHACSLSTHWIISLLLEDFPGTSLADLGRWRLALLPDPCLGQRPINRSMGLGDGAQEADSTGIR